MSDLVRTWPTRSLFGLHVDAMTSDQVIDLAEQALATRRRLLIGVINAAKVIHLRSDAVLRESLLQCDVVLADGQAVVWASQLLGQPLPERVAGIDLFEQLLALADRDARSVYLLGAKPSVLWGTQEAIRSRWPGVRIAGSHDGYFADEGAYLIAADIAACDADMLFIAMPSPKKENFLAAHSAHVGVPIMHGVGGSFDVLSGLTKRAPKRWQRWGCEWLYRVLQEPRRLWRRYLTTNIAFVFLLIRERFHPTRSYVSSSAVSSSTVSSSQVSSTTASEESRHA